MNTELIITLALVLAGVIGIPAGLLIAYGRMKRKMMADDRKDDERALGGSFID